MIIAYDLRYASDHFPGIGTHAYALIEALLELPGQDRFVLLWNPDGRNSRYDFDRLRSSPRVDWVERRYHAIQPWGAVQVGAWLREVRPDVYFSPFSLRPVASGCPEVLTIYDVAPLRVHHAWSAVIQALYLLSLRYAVTARFIVTCSEFSRREIVELTAARAEHVRVTPLGVAPRVRGVDPRRPDRLTAERFALVVSDNRPRKNLDLLARAWAGMGDVPQLALVAVGPADPRFPSLLDRAAHWGAHGVEHLGWVKPEELAWLYAHAQVVLLPSTYEGFGYPLVEAMAEGVPALVSDIPVLREVGAEAAIYADPCNPADWVQAVLRLTGDAGVYERMRQLGRERATELTYQKTAEATLAVLREAAASRR
jgi:glycosyltransferase involved in cell wall biosynthesis